MNDYSFLPPHPRNKAQVPIKVEIGKLEEAVDILGMHHENGMKSVGGGLWAIGIGLGVGLGSLALGMRSLR